jgi:LysR family transcriptional regulator, glycine cleavage system transcriptional activator
MMSRPIRGFGALPSFAAAARWQSFTDAAEELGVTQAAVSHQVRELEEQLGVKLFLRTGRAVRLTAAGELLKKAVDGAFIEIAQAMSQLKPTKPSLRVTSSPSFAAKWLVPRLDRFLEQVPDVDVFIDIQHRITELSNHDHHVAIMFGAGHFPSHQVDRLGDEYVVPVCSPMLLKKGARQKRDPKELLRNTLLDVDWHSQGATWPNWETWLDAANLTDAPHGRTVRFVHSSLAIQAAIDGQGIALGDSTLVADDLSAGRLIKPFDLVLRGPPQYAYFLVCRRGLAKGAIETLFRDWLLREIAAPPMKGRKARTKRAR